MLNHLKIPADYLELALRRKYLIGGTWVLVTILSVLVAFQLPKTYKSTAKLLIEAPIPTNLISAGLSQYADLQIQSIYRKIFTTSNIESFIQSQDLYSELKGESDKLKAVQLFKENLEIDLSNSTLVPQAGSERAEIAFNISFNYTDPEKTRNVASIIANRFILENDQVRVLRAEKTTGFLMEESEKLQKEIQDIDSRIAQFKEKYSLSLPDQIQSNLALIDRNENELRDTEMEILSTKERIALLSAELTQAKQRILPDAGADGPRNTVDALSLLRAKYLKYSSKYSPSHPSVIRLEQEIKALDPSFEGQLGQNEIRRQLGGARQKLKKLEESYASDHPEIMKVRTQIERLEQDLADLPKDQQAGRTVRIPHSVSPAYLGLEAQYRSGLIELESLQQKKEYLQEKIQKMHNIVSQAPQVELEYNDLVRMRENMIKKYTQLRDKLLDAELVESLEQEQQGQTLTILEQPLTPLQPEKSIRRKVAIVGSLAGIFVGLGLALFFEFIEPGIRGYRAISEVTELMPLIVLPYIESPAEIEKNIARQGLIRKVVIYVGAGFMITTVYAALVIFFPFK